MIYSLFRNTFKVILKLFFGLKAYGVKNVPKKGGVIIASNHVSYVDPMILGSAVPRRLDFMARASLFKNFFVRAWMKAVSTFPVKRGSADLKAVREAVRRLHKGKALGMFPEGTRSLDGNIQQARLGLAIIAKLSGVKVVPAYIKGSRNILPRGSKRLKRAKTSVYFGEAIKFSWDSKSAESKQEYRLFTQELMNRIAWLKAQAEK